MKFNNENSQEQMAYVAPRMKVFQVQITSSILQASQNGDSWLYSNPNSAGNDMTDDDNYNYSF